MDKTGFDAVGFKPFGNQVAIILTEEDLEILESKNAKQPEKPRESPLVNSKGKPKIIKGRKTEDEDKAAELAKKRENRTFTVAAVSDSVSKLDGQPSVGDEISLLAGTMVEVEVEGTFYGVIPVHRCLAVHAKAIR